MAIEAIVLNRPGKGIRLSKSELHALAGWPGRNPGKKGTKKKGKAMKRNKSGVPKTARGKRWRTVVKKYGVIKGAKVWKRMKKPKYAANAWKGDQKGHRKAALKGWAKKKRLGRNYGTVRGARKTAKRAGMTKHAYFAKLGRKGAKARWGMNKGYARNYGVKKYGAKKRPYRRNPAGLAAFKKSFKELFSLNTLLEGLQVTGGGMLSVAVPTLVLNAEFLKDKEGNSRVPEVLRTGWGKYLVNLVATGLSSGAAAYFGKTKLSKNFLIGGVAATLNSVILEQVGKAAAKPGAGETVKKLAAAVSPGGMGILTQDVDQAVAEAVEAELARQGLSDYLVPAETEAPALVGTADYLTPAEASSPTLAQAYLTPSDVVTHEAGTGIITDAEAVEIF